MEAFIIQMVLTLIKQAVTNPAKAEELKTALLGLRDEISGLYPGA